MTVLVITSLDELQFRFNHFYPLCKYVPFKELIGGLLLLSNVDFSRNQKTYVWELLEASLDFDQLDEFHPFNNVALMEAMDVSIDMFMECFYSFIKNKTGIDIEETTVCNWKILQSDLYCELQMQNGKR